MSGKTVCYVALTKAKFSDSLPFTRARVISSFDNLRYESYFSDLYKCESYGHAQSICRAANLLIDQTNDAILRQRDEFLEKLAEIVKNLPQEE